MFAVIILRYTPGFILLATKDDCTADCADLADLLRAQWDGYRGSEIKDHGIERARSIIAAGCKELQFSLKELRRQAKNDWRKALLLVHPAVLLSVARALALARTSATEVPGQTGAQSRNSAACPCVAPSTTTIHTTAPEMRKRVPSFAIRTPW